MFKRVCTGAESFLAGTSSCRIEVQEINELFSEYKKAGVLHQYDSSIETKYWGVQEFATVDLDGNLLTFYESI